MPSPFPGMDPYVEACRLWEDFHHDLILEIKHVLASALPARYVVRAGERAYLVLSPVEGESQQHAFLSDVSVASTPGDPATKGEGGMASAAIAPGGEPPPVSIQAMVETEYREV